MYYLKNSIFLNLTKNQKASLFSFLKSFVKKYKDKDFNTILELFIEEEQYYEQVQNPHFEWIIPMFNDDNFLQELKILIKENIKQINFKESQKPFLEKQKQLAKEQRKKHSEKKMAKEKPTQKQLYYYDKLCKKYNITKSDITDCSRLDLKEMIGKILEDEQRILE